MICCITALVHPKSWLRKKWWWGEKKKLQEFIFFKWGEMESSKPQKLGLAMKKMEESDATRQEKIEESWKDGRIWHECGTKRSKELWRDWRIVKRWIEEESWGDGRISREFCLKLWGLVDSWNEEEEGRRKQGRSCSGILMMLMNVAWSTRMVSPYQTRSEIPLLQQFRFGNFLFVLSTWMEMVCCTTAAAAPNLTAKALSSPSFFPKASPFLLR